MKRVNLTYPVSAREPQSADGLIDNHHLNGLDESVDVNVGDLNQNVKVSSPPMSDSGVGGFIVVRG
jgi:hypothetical protein